MLRRFRRFADGTPSYDHLGDIVVTLDAQAFLSCFVAWAHSNRPCPGKLQALKHMAANIARTNRVATPCASA